MERQIRINGIVEKIDEISDNYWNSRPLNSRISALFLSKVLRLIRIMI